MPVLHTRPLRRQFTSSLISLGGFFQLFCIVVNIIVPFIIAYQTDSLWVKKNIFLEMPTTKFTHQAFLTLYTSTPGKILQWSTVPKANELYGTSLRPCEITALEMKNNAGIVEDLRLDVKVPLNPGESIIGVNFFATVNMTLEDKFQLSSDGVIYINQMYPVSGLNLTVMGELVTLQRTPLQIKPLAAPILIDPATIHHMADIEIPNLMAVFYERNVRPMFQEFNHFWKAGPSDIFAQFEFTVLVKIPKQRIEYVPGILEVLKFGWIQYYTLGAIIWFFVGLFRDAVFDHQIVDTFVDDEEHPDAAVAAPPHSFNAFHLHQQ